MRSCHKSDVGLSLAFLYWHCYWCLVLSLTVYGVAGQIAETESVSRHHGGQSADGDTTYDYFTQQTKNIKKYEVITPAIYNAGGFASESATIFSIGAFGRTYDISLPKRNGSNYETLVEFLGTNSSYEARYVREDGCYYSGQVNDTNNESLDVVLSYCNGIEGMIRSNDSLIFIEPIHHSKSIHRQHIVYRGEDVQVKTEGDFEPEEVFSTPPLAYQPPAELVPASAPRRERRAVKMTPYQSYLTFINKSGRKTQLYYLDAFKAHIPFISFVLHEKRSVNTYVGTTWIAKDDESGQEFLLNGKTEFIASKSSVTRRTVVIITQPNNFREMQNHISGSGQLTNSVGGDHHYIEVLVVADESVIKFHGRNKIEKYILTMMDIASRVFKHKSLGLIIHFQVVRIVLIEDNESGFTVYNKNPTKTLKSACNFISSLQNPDENDRDHFDFGIALTRKDFGPSGFAQLYSMCSRSRSCALVQDEGLTSAFIVAHETGHLLGLEHDGEGEASRCIREGPRGSIMAPVIVARYDRYRWSKCSKEVLKENIEYFQCLTNTPRQRFRPSLRNHGSLYSLTEQCQFNFDKDYTTCTSFTFNPCRRLWCSKANSNSYCKTMRGPALEGTICAKDKHCVKGDCVEFDNHIRAQDLGAMEIKTVHGGWSAWTQWSSCSRTCRAGIRVRRRHCDNPFPTSDGRPCSGIGIEREVCNTQKCDVEPFIATQIKHCQAAYGDQWTVYSDADLAARLQSPETHLNCSFESNLCNWKNDQEKNKINWETNNGATQSFNTGPTNDHTHKSPRGKYLYVEASGTRHHAKRKGDISRLVSKSITIPRLCFTLYYHMFGRDMGSLHVKIKHKNNTEHVLWEKFGNQGDQWYKTQISVESVASYKLLVEGVRGQHWASDIAIDDISAVTGLCDADSRSRYECKVSCRTKDSGVFKMNANVTDGEQCGGPRSSDICVDGECVTFGCDNKFGSKKRIDDCGICGGNGSECTKVKRSKEIIPSKDYEILLTLERGTTFVDIGLRYEEEKYYYGLRTADNSLKMIMKEEALVSVANTAFKFAKPNEIQKVTADGPLSEQVDVILYTYPQHRRKRKVYLDYILYRPAGVDFTYEYKTIGWHPCTKSCGTGEQKSSVACTRVQDKLTVDESYCKGLEVPMYIRACKLDPCPERYKWSVKAWKQCSKTCDGGVRVRDVLCRNLKTGKIVEKKLCPQVRPKHKETCNKNPCPKWHTSKWGECSLTCGSGLQTRAVKCIDQTNGNEVSDDKCVRKNRPDHRAPCNTQPCETYIWIISRVGKSCSKSCGGGLRIQIINCVKNSTRAPVKSFYCDGPSPPRLIKCNAQKCPEFVWKVRSSSCSKTCGIGVITREVYCVNLENDEKSAESNCRAAKPKTHLPCNDRKCPVYRWKVHSPTSCSVTCGKGVIRRQVVCLDKDTYKEVDVSNCQNVGSKPSATTTCLKGRCPMYKWTTGSWSPCSTSCGNGTALRDVKCVDADLKKTVESKNCEAPKPSQQTTCESAPCRYYKWKVMESSPCSTTCGNGSIIREIICADRDSGRKADRRRCPRENKPADVLPCYLKHCVNYEVRYGAWGRCSVSCGTGVKRRTFSCYESYSRQLVSDKLCRNKPLKLARKCRSTASCRDGIEQNTGRVMPSNNREGDKLQCNFDKQNFCKWKNAKDDDFDWVLGKKTPSVYTGPEFDHTSKQGYFAYIEASLPRRRSDTARLQTPHLNLPRGCFIFWYHMRGEGDMGRLRVLLSSHGGSKQLMFERNGHQGDDWVQGKIFFKRGGSFRLIFEATRGSGVYSDVAIDDVSYQLNTCHKIKKTNPLTGGKRKNRKCREISPYCKHRNRELYCRGSPAYRKLCCRTCPQMANKKPNITVVKFTRKN